MRHILAPPPSPAAPARYHLSADEKAGRSADKSRAKVAFSLPHPGVRVQLTLWYMVIFSLLLLLAGILVYVNLKNSLASGPDTSLQLRAQQLAGDVHLDHQQHIVLHGTLSDLPGFDKRDDRLTSQADVNFDNLVRLLDIHGHVIGETPAFQKIQMPPASITQPLQGTPWQGTVRVSEEDIRFYSRTIAEDGKVFAVIQVGASLEVIHDVLAQVTTELLIAAFFVLLLGALGSYWLAGHAFAPMRHLIEVARTIKEGDLRRRVPVPPTSDEMQALALTFNEMLARLEMTLNRQRRFVSDASHELRTPVAVIRSKTELALQQPGDAEEYVTVLRQVHSESERLGHLINDLLALARADEGNARFEMETVPLHLLAEAVAANAESLALERGVTLHVQTGTPVNVRGDEARLIQVIMNLLDNAIRYTNAGGSVTLDVACTQTSATLTVRDTGIGISPEHLPHIFDRFYRVDSSRARTDNSNNGLGLAIVDWIVRAHHGTIDVESQPGHGSTFTVTLPCSLEHP